MRCSFLLFFVILMTALSACTQKDPSQDYAIQNAVESDGDPDIPLP